MISFANTKREGETAVIIQHILAILSKLKRSLVLKEHVMYEVRLKCTPCFGFCAYLLQLSLRGKWPAERYQRILELQMCGPLFDLDCFVAHGLSQPNIKSFVSFDICLRANGACMDTGVLEADAVVRCGLPGRCVGRH